MRKAASTISLATAFSSISAFVSFSPSHRVERRRAEFRSISFRRVRPFEPRGKELPDHAYVSFSPSKIPYDGFSPVRLHGGSESWRRLPRPGPCSNRTDDE